MERKELHGGKVIAYVGEGRINMLDTLREIVEKHESAFSIPDDLIKQLSEYDWDDFEGDVYPILLFYPENGEIRYGILDDPSDANEMFVTPSSDAYSIINDLGDHSIIRRFLSEYTSGPFAPPEDVKAIAEATLERMVLVKGDTCWHTHGTYQEHFVMNKVKDAIGFVISLGLFEEEPVQ